VNAEGPLKTLLSDIALISLYKDGKRKDRNFAYLALKGRYDREVCDVLKKLGYQGTNVTESPVYAEAQVAFIDAILKFDPARKVQFNTFLEWHVRTIVRRYCVSYEYGVTKFASSLEYKNDDSSWQLHPEVLRMSAEKSSDKGRKDQPLYKKLDTCDAIDEALSRQYSPATAMAVKALVGCASHYTLTKTEATKLAGSESKEHLSLALANLSPGEPSDK